MVKSHIAKTIKDALEALQANAYVIVAGGTDMLIQNRSHTGMSIGFKKPVLYVNLIKEMDYIRSDESNIYIGANTRLETILKHQETPKVLKDIIGEMASPAIRHTATLAGNIANASPAGDSLVALYLLDAKVKIQRLGQSRLTKVSDVILGVRKVDLKIDEMITEIIIPKVSFDRIVFKKVAPRQSDAISKLSFVGAITVNHGVIEDIRFAFGAVYMTVVRNPSIEASYVGWTIEALKANIDQIINDYDPLIQPIDDQRSNRIYRKKVAINLIKDFINQS